MASISFTERSGNEKKAGLYTIIICAIFLLILIFWKIKYEDNVIPGGGGIEVDFGNSAYGLGDDNTSLGTPAPENPVAPIQESAPTISSPTHQSTPEIKPSAPTVTNTPKPSNNTLTSSNADAIAIEKQRKEAEKAAQAKAKAEAEAEAKRKAEEERKRKEQEEFAQKMQGGLSGIKNGTGTGGTGSGSGQGNTQSGGNQGDPNGSMNGGNGTGGSGGGTGGGIGSGTGSGTGSGSSIGNHTLTGRNMISKPSFINKSNALGKVMIRVSVDRKGNVIAASFSSQGSTTNDAYLIQLSISEAKKIKFSPSPNGAEEQFGVITFNYNP